jgi:hypothetical protein
MFNDPIEISTINGAYHEQDSEPLSLKVKAKSDFSLLTNIAPGSYNYTVKSLKWKKTGVVITDNFKPGGIYTVILNQDLEKNYEVLEDVHHNTFNMAWIVIQYFIITCSEVLISITGLEFAYKQAPKRMKSLLQACWLSTTAVGNMINTVLSKFSTNGTNRDKEFFVLGICLFAMTLLMTINGYYYSYTENDELKAIDDLEDDGKKDGKDEKMPLKEFPAKV